MIRMEPNQLSGAKRRGCTAPYRLSDPLLEAYRAHHLLSAVTRSAERSAAALCAGVKLAPCGCREPHARSQPCRLCKPRARKAMSAIESTLLPPDALRDALPFQPPPQLPHVGGAAAPRSSERCKPAAPCAGGSTALRRDEAVPAVAAATHWPTDVFDGLALVASSSASKGLCGCKAPGAAPEPPSRFETLALRHSSVPMLVLWNVFLFWVSVAVVTHRQTLLIPTVVATAMGICTIVGITLNTNAYAMWLGTRAPEQESSLKAFLREGPCSALRFFMIPFCVASYSGIVNQEASIGTFTYLFPTRGRDGTQLVDGVPDTLVFIAVLATLTVAMRLLRKHVQRRVTTESSETDDELTAVENPL